MGQSVSFLLATSSPESVTQKFVLERFPTQGWDLATPPDVSNAVTFWMVLLVVRISWHYPTSVFSPPLLPCFLHPCIPCTWHINRKAKFSDQKDFFFFQNPGENLHNGNNIAGQQLFDKAPLRRCQQTLNAVIFYPQYIDQHFINFPEG